jgi:acyl-CoA thioester hydrolase
MTPETLSGSSHESDTGRIEEGWHVLPLRVYWEDTDAAGIVYYANYLKFIERGRTDMLRHMGIAQRELQQEDDVAFAVRSCQIEYLKPARLDDRIEVWTRVTAAGGATLNVEQVVRSQGQDLITSELRLACINAAGRPKRIPQAVRTALGPLLP